MRYDSEHKAKTRDLILKEAANAIRSDGVANVGVAQIMSRAGLTHGGFYAHFASKDELVAQAVEYMFVDRYAKFLAHSEGIEPATALANFVERYLSMAHRDATDRGCPIPMLAGQVPHLPEAARTRFMLAVERLTTGVADLLDQLGAHDVEVLAASMIAEMVGALGMARVQPDDAKAGQLLAAARASVTEKIARATRSI
ncbi:MAG: bacterial regulatory, tetR family protein [Sphingomonadales bacterium]|nr:bacterial regulatory, tetR family protein [Sphingomonadales bacterium]